MRLVPLALAVCLAANSAAFAQTPTTQPNAEATSGEQVLDLDLNQVPLPDYIDYLADTTHANLVLFADNDLDLSSLRLPRMRLRQITLWNALDLLNSVPGVRFEIESKENAKIPTYVIRVHGVGGDRAGGKTVVTRVIPLEKILLGNDPSETVPNPKERAQVLADKIPSAMQLVEETLRMQFPTGNLPELRLHDATHTLLIKGDPERIAVVSDALNAVSLPRLTDEKRDLQSQIEQVMMKVNEERKTSEVEKDLLKERMAEIKVERDKYRGDAESLRFQLLNESYARKAAEEALSAQRSQRSVPTTQP